MASLRGKLIVAGPKLYDPNFHRTVVLICEHTDDGALGLIVNRPTPVEVGDAVPELGELLGPTDRLFAGGPVQPQSIVLLAELEDPPEEALMVTGDVGLVLQGVDLEDLAAMARRGRAFLGYAGWGPGQLEDELAEEAWIIEPPTREEIFTLDPTDLWAAVLRRKGHRYALLATMPPDPSLN